MTLGGWQLRENDRHLIGENWMRGLGMKALAAFHDSGGPTNLVKLKND
jgi:hypothetical protein